MSGGRFKWGREKKGQFGGGGGTRLRGPRPRWGVRFGSPDKRECGSPDDLCTAIDPKYPTSSRRVSRGGRGIYS